MHPDYFLNHDTQDITRHVGELALQNEPLLRANCQEVSRQTDTSCSRLQEESHAKEQALNATVKSVVEILHRLVQMLSANANVFGTKDSRTDFSAVCQAVVGVEEARVRLIAEIAALSNVRHSLAASVANANRALHYLSFATSSVPKDQRSFYAEAFQKTEMTYQHLLALDTTLQKWQNAYMSLVELHFSTFLQKVRAAADFAHAGAALQSVTLRSLCGEMLLLLERLARSAFDENCDEKLRNS